MSGIIQALQNSYTPHICLGYKSFSVSTYMHAPVHFNGTIELNKFTVFQGSKILFISTINGCESFMLSLPLCPHSHKFSVDGRLSVNLSMLIRARRGTEFDQIKVYDLLPCARVGGKGLARREDERKHKQFLFLFFILIRGKNEQQALHSPTCLNYLLVYSFPPPSHTTDDIPCGSRAAYMHTAKTAFYFWPTA